MDIYNKVLDTISKYNLINDGDKLVLGVSGGADSMALLDIIKTIRDKRVYDISFSVCTCDHNTRDGESTNDANFVKKYCDDLNIECKIYNLDLNKAKEEYKLSSDEEAGRKLRYEAFLDMLNETNSTKIVTAHNLSDNTETILLNLIRGTGLNGLCGIPKKKGKVIRPLIEVSKDDIKKYCIEKNIEFKEDKTNSEDTFTRNKLRLNVIPYIKENINENLDDTIKNCSSIMSLERDYIEEQVLLAYNKVTSHYIENDDKNTSKDIIKINLEEFNKYHLAIKKRLIKHAIVIVNDMSSKDITNSHIDLVLDIIEKGTGKQITILNDITLRVSYNDLLVYKDNDVETRRDLVLVNNKESYEVALINDLNKVKEINKNDLDSNQIVYDAPNGIKLKIRTLNKEQTFMMVNKLNSDNEEEKNNFINELKDLSKEKMYFDFDKIKKKINIISDDNELNNISSEVFYKFKQRCDGDKILLDNDENYKKLKDIFIDLKIDKLERDNYIVFEKVLANKETNDIISSDIIAILGLRISPKYMIDKDTQDILEIEICHE